MNPKRLFMMLALPLVLLSLPALAQDKIVTGTVTDLKDGKPIAEKGFANVPDTPGLGIELVEEEIKKHLDPENKTYFAPTPEWDNVRSWDRLWS